MGNLTPSFPPSKLVSMVQAIRDLANAFVPSGRLIELVDFTLVRPPIPFGAFVLLSLKASERSVPSCLQPLMADTLPHPFGDEIRGIAAASGVPLGSKISLFFSPALSAFKGPPLTSVLFSKLQGKSSCLISSMRCSLCARRSWQKIIRVGRVPPSDH